MCLLLEIEKDRAYLASHRYGAGLVEAESSLQEHSRERGRVDGGGAGRSAAGRQDSQETCRIAQEKQVNLVCNVTGISTDKRDTLNLVCIAVEFDIHSAERSHR